MAHESMIEILDSFELSLVIGGFGTAGAAPIEQPPPGTLPPPAGGVPPSPTTVTVLNSNDIQI